MLCVSVTSSCNSEVANNVTYFVNPNFPGLLNDVGECSLRVKKISKDISQIRLDFVNFNLVSVLSVQRIRVCYHSDTSVTDVGQLLEIIRDLHNFDCACLPTKQTKLCRLSSSLRTSTFSNRKYLSTCCKTPPWVHTSSTLSNTLVLENIARLSDV